MSEIGVWTPERKKVLKAMIEGLQDAEIRQSVIKMLEGY